MTWTKSGTSWYHKIMPANFTAKTDLLSLELFPYPKNGYAKTEHIALMA